MLPGVHRVTARDKDGLRTYWYAWRGGPRILSARGATAAELEAAVTAKAAEAARLYHDSLTRREPTREGLLSGLAYAWEKSPEFARLAPRTQRDHKRHLAVIRDDLGDMPLTALSAKGARRALLDWRDGYADKPRTADHYVACLDQLLAWARDRGRIDADPLDRWPRLYSVDRSNIIWSAGDIEAICAQADEPLRLAILLAVTTGLRKADLLALSWTAVGAETLSRRTNKRGKTVHIPLTPDARAVLDACPRISPTVLTRDGRPWKETTLDKQFAAARAAAGVKDKRWHDLRGSYASTLRIAGVDHDAIDRIMGWAAGTSSSYVGSEAVALTAIERLRRA